jgi:hypothetical protein
MRPISLALALATVSGLAPGVGAQAVERTDTPRRGAVRLTFDPTTTIWDAAFTSQGRRSLGWALSGDTVRVASAGPALATFEQDIRTASGLPAFVASLGAGILAVHQERRVTPIGAEFGITDRFSLGVMVPVVRVQTRARLNLSAAGASIGANPRWADPGTADTSYAAFFSQFDTALVHLDDSIAVWCPSNPQCAGATALSARGHVVRLALGRSVFGAPGRPAPFLPIDSSDGGKGIDSTLLRLQADLATFGAGGFTHGLLLPSGPLDPAEVGFLLGDTLFGFGIAPFQNTRRGLRYFPGDAELTAKYRIATGDAYAAAVALVLRLPTGHVASSNDPFGISTGDHQTDVEGRLTQDLTVAGRLWLNLCLRAAVQRPGERWRRLAAPDAFLVPYAATAKLRWEPGDYLQVDFAPLVRLGRFFAAGVTGSYYTKRRDRYAFLGATDSAAVAARLGGPVSPAILETGTAERRLRLGWALSYVGPVFEGGLSIEQTVSGAGSVVPAATVFRLVMRASRPLF